MKFKRNCPANYMLFIIFVELFEISQKKTFLEIRQRIFTDFFYARGRRKLRPVILTQKSRPAGRDFF